MKVKRQRIYIAVGILVFLSVGAGMITLAQEPDKAQIQQEFRRRLSESDGVFVLVNIIAKDKADEESMKTQVQEDVELELKNSDIKIFTKDELEFKRGRPRLGVYIVTYKESGTRDVYLYSFRVVHFEDATLDRNDRYAEGICWDSGLYIGREKIVGIKRLVRTHVRKYINDYLAANPKRQ